MFPCFFHFQGYSEKQQSIFERKSKMKTKFIKAITLCLALLMCVTCAVPASAAEYKDATINVDAECSLTIWKFDWTNAVKDGVWNEDSFVSTGWRESYVEEVLGNTIRKGDSNGDPDNTLGNGQNSNGYAIKGVGFSIANVATITTFTESENDQHPDYNLTKVLYAFNKNETKDLLLAIGLGNGKDRYENADYLDNNYWFYESDVLNKALATALAENSTTVKDALEAFMAANPNRVFMSLTDNNGKTIQRNLSVGLYLVVEDIVPEMVTCTTNPFFISLPMTTVSGDANSSSPEGGHYWNYDVVVYPKNETGIPTLEKTVREAKKDTGTHNGSNSITDGFAHNATASAGDVLEYQIISTLPTITSNATSLTTYNFYDTIIEGLTYNKSVKDVKIEFFTDANCTDKVATWVQGDGKFNVTYSSDDRHMTIDITAAGLAEINGNTANTNGKLYAGYSNYTARVTYTAIINSDATFVYGQEGNDNKVVLTWKRTSSEYYDTLIDDCHVYSFGIDITKLFSDKDSETAEETGMFKHVKFKIYNETDGYWVTASRNEEENVYYVTGHVTEEADATIFYPVTTDAGFGHVMIKGCEDDVYRITEVETMDGYTLLKESIYVKIVATDDASRPCNIYSQDILGVLQNDPRYAFNGGLDLSLANIPQTQLAHNYMTASASVDNNSVTMLEDNGSANAEAPLTVVNTSGFDLPQTGDMGTAIFAVTGILLMAGAGIIILFACRKKKSHQ
jgi:fimbrial isopeptide formation D2 family protein/LPXTG-motif cell wall-anchored protein